MKHNKRIIRLGQLRPEEVACLPVDKKVNVLLNTVRKQAEELAKLREATHNLTYLSTWCTVFANALDAHGVSSLSDLEEARRAELGATNKALVGEGEHTYSLKILAELRSEDGEGDEEGSRAAP